MAYYDQGREGLTYNDRRGQWESPNVKAYRDALDAGMPTVHRSNGPVVTKALGGDEWDDDETEWEDEDQAPDWDDAEDEFTDEEAEIGEFLVPPEVEHEMRALFDEVRRFLRSRKRQQGRPVSPRVERAHRELVRTFVDFCHQRGVR
jgi:hypothetical protein